MLIVFMFIGIACIAVGECLIHSGVHSANVLCGVLGMLGLAGGALTVFYTVDQLIQGIQLC